MTNQSKVGILAAVSDWLKLLALVVLVAEGMIIVAMQLTPDTNPLKQWYPVFMLLFLIIVVVGVFIDRFTQTKLGSELTLAVGEREISVETNKIRAATDELEQVDDDLMFVDSQNGFMFRRPISPLWSEPQYLTSGELLLKMGVLENLEGWNAAKEAAAIIPMGRMISEAKYVLFQHGDSLKVELTDETSNKVVDSVVERTINLIEQEGEEVDLEFVRDLRKQIILANNPPEKYKFGNTFSVSIFDKALAQNSPVEVSLGNFFLFLVKQTGQTVDGLAANERSILWGASQTLTSVLVNAKLGELTTYYLNNLVEHGSRFYQLSISFSPQTEGSIVVWEQLREVLNSFRIIPQ